ncbi:hypothetical protein PoB_001886200 [Plakobranchus ocellatus]|uniref:Uncharacterized protein n=1 Tax=Plakobranchus ocellatus TaxID=259542 RepID=A0AAV3ZAS9_9GAST|nr:hypothetical protein PoB_001886200 [Plakobranchus ocellatus]
MNAEHINPDLPEQSPSKSNRYSFLGFSCSDGSLAKPPVQDEAPMSKDPGLDVFEPVVQDEEENQKNKENGENQITKSGSHHSDPKLRSNSSDNNCTAIAIPCCQKRKCKCPKKCPPGTVRVCCDPCCNEPCISTAVIDNANLKHENKVLR